MKTVISFNYFQIENILSSQSLPFCTVKMKIDELVCPQFSGNLDDMSTYTGRLLQDVLANVVSIHVCRKNIITEKHILH